MFSDTLKKTKMTIESIRFLIREFLFEADRSRVLPRRTETIYVEGTQRVLVFAKKRDGSSPAQEFIDSLPNAEKNSIQRYITAFSQGQRLSDTQFKIESKQTASIRGTHKTVTIVAFKAFQARLLGVMEGTINGKSRLALTNGLIKKKDKMPTTDLNRAITIFEEYEDYLAR